MEITEASPKFTHEHEDCGLPIVGVLSRLDLDDTLMWFIVDEALNDELYIDFCPWCGEELPKTVKETRKVMEAQV